MLLIRKHKNSLENQLSDHMTDIPDTWQVHHRIFEVHSQTLSSSS